MSENSTNELLIRMEEKYKKMSKGQKRLAVSGSRRERMAEGIHPSCKIAE